MATNEAWVVDPNSNSSASSTTIPLTKTAQPIPTPGPNQLLIRLTAAALNYRDLLVVRSSPEYPVATTPGLVPCSDGAGVVVTAGSAQSAFKPGDRVMLHPNTWLDGDVTNFRIDSGLGGGDVDGALRRYAVLNEERVVRAPGNLTEEETAALGTAGSTAWQALFEGPEGTRCEAGMTVLAQGTGGVSCFVIQLAAAAGAEVIATSSSDKKLELAMKLGARHVINYKKNPNWSEEVLRITGGKGVDHVVDVGGAGTIEESLKSARYGGLVSVVGILSESQQTDLIPLILFGARTVCGVLGAGSRKMKDALAKFVEEHDIHPLIARTYKFDDALEAFKELEQQTSVGKIVVRVN